MKKDSNMLSSLTIIGFIIAVGSALYNIHKEFGNDSNFKRLLSDFIESFTDPGMIYAYIAWAIFLTIYIVLGFFEKVHDKLPLRCEDNLEVINYYYTLWFWGSAAHIVHHANLISNTVLPIFNNPRYILIIPIAFLLGIWGLYLVIMGRVYINGYWATHIYKYPNHKIVTDGIYGKVRHPIYGGQILLTISIFLVCNNKWLFFLPLLTFVYNCLRAKKEERALDRVLNGEYNKYAQKCSSYMIHPIF